jgi:hypothetical protein
LWRYDFRHDAIAVCDQDGFATGGELRSKLCNGPPGLVRRSRTPGPPPFSSMYSGRVGASFTRKVMCSEDDESRKSS